MSVRLKSGRSPVRSRPWPPKFAGGHHAASPAADAVGELSREALSVACAAGQIDRAPVASQIDDVLIHEGPRRRIAFVA
jgi:hypothetical protein